MSAGPLLSTTWFAPDQRATATAIASLIGYLGSAGAFLIGPLVVPAPNETLIASSTIHWDQNHIKDSIQFVLYTGVHLSSENPQTLLFLINTKLFLTFAQQQKSNHSKAIHAASPNTTIKCLNVFCIHLSIRTGSHCSA